MSEIDFDADEITVALRGEILEIVKEDARAIVRSVVLATPVGNPALWQNPPPISYEPGTARANWQIGLGNPENTILFEQDPDGGTTIARAWTRIETWRSFNQALWLSNNVPYIGRLNDGWSVQAPAGFIEQAILIAQSRGVGERVELP